MSWDLLQKLRRRTYDFGSTDSLAEEISADVMRQHDLQHGGARSDSHALPAGQMDGKPGATTDGKGAPDNAEQMASYRERAAGSCDVATRERRVSALLVACCLKSLAGPSTAVHA